VNAGAIEDRAGPVRAGEELPVAAVHAWLAERLPGLEGLPQVTQFAGGASNWTYRLHYPRHDLVLRRPPAGTRAKSAHDMTREFTVQERLRPVFPYVPRMIGLCQDEAVIGAEFYVMERIPGIILRRRLPDGLHLEPARARALGHALIDRLVELHSVDPVAAGLASLSRGSGYARRQVEGWSDRYERARTWNVPRFRRVRDWLRDQVPDDIASRVIHNDWRLDNLVLDPADPARIVAVLDWEMATIGDPLMELGSALAYWVQAGDDPLMRMTRRQPTHLLGMPTRAEVVERYLERTGFRPGSWAFYEVFGLFRLAVIAQQIYFRYHHRQTRNPAFRNFWVMINYFAWRCGRIIRRSRRGR
jgi:aminoglycoside phosphotransferase (APT) family kinase protein